MAAHVPAKLRKDPAMMRDRPHAPPSERRIHRLFELSVLLKGLHALVELIGGIALYFFSTSILVALMNRLAASELIEDPGDFAARHLQQFAASFSVDAHHFYAVYLLSHGIVKIVLVAGLLRERLWAYPASIGVLGLFIAYQLYRFSYTHEWMLVALSLFDSLVMFLAWHEYRLLRKHWPTH